MKFQVQILSFDSIQELPGSWEKSDYVNLLNSMDYENPSEIKDAELKEMCMLAMTDYQPAEAARAVLDYVIGERLTPGQIENLAHEIQTEKLWEEYPELALHPDFFRATQLLYQAYNGKFPRGEAVRFQVEIQGESLADEQPQPALLVRILAAGMSDRSLIHRLFSDQLAGAAFPEATDMLWQVRVTAQEGDKVTYEICSSAYWLEEIKYADSFEAEAEPDAVGEPEA